MGLSGSYFPLSYKAIFVIPEAIPPNSPRLHKILLFRTVGLRTTFLGWNEENLVLQADIEPLTYFLHHFYF